jgi:hypothetical protein
MAWRFFQFLFLLLLPATVLLEAGCRREGGRDVAPAFYHWRTQYALTPVEEAYLDSLEVEKLYVRFFDVDWDADYGGAVPLAVLNAEGPWKTDLEIVPVIFITNRTLLQLPLEQVPELSRRIHRKLFELVTRFPPPSGIREIQFDCDWSGQTREKFFLLIEEFRKLQANPEMALSATIRLHQVRHFELTGVPPVDRGMLMFYNMGRLEDWDEPNSILNLEAARPYLENARRYPLKLDLALPVFAWGVLFRQGRMIRLINNLHMEALTDTARFVKTAPNRFEVKKSTYLEGYYLYKGDQIRLEQIGHRSLTEAAVMLSRQLKNEPLTVAFYHLDTATIKHFPNEILEKVCRVLAEN